MDATETNLQRIATALERIADSASGPKARLLHFSEVPSVYPRITERMIRDACNVQPDGPRKFKDAIVSTEEIDAWIVREAKKRGVRS